MKTAIVRFYFVLVAIVCVALPTGAFAQAAAAAAASPAPAKREVTSFHGTIDAVDAAAKTFTTKNKKVTRTYAMTPTTNVLKRVGGNASFDDLKAGDYVSGSAKKSGDNQFKLVSLKVGPKDPAAPKKTHKKAAAAAAKPSPAM